MNPFEPMPSGGPPLLSGPLHEAVALLVTEAQDALALVVLPWECDLGPRPDLRSARAGVRRHLGAALHPDSLADVLLVMGELVANAYQHTASPRRLRVGREGCGVRVEVTDGDRDAVPVVRPHSSDLRRGRGLLLVRELSLSWGVRPAVDGGPGKTVWSVLQAHPGAAH
ncbi:ATP-binding protein [Umezawaea tangerina]|nr:ATP-binding protein [Umezawaea tangerina]